MDTNEFDAFSKIIADLCTAYDRPFTDDRARVFWEDLKRYHLLDIKKSAELYRKFGKKMPAPRDLIPERKERPSAPPPSNEPKMSHWAVAANTILLHVAYFDIRRGFTPMCTYEPNPAEGWNKVGGVPWQKTPTNSDAFHKALDAKADYVTMAEVAEAEGQPWDEVEFNTMCRQGFEKILGTPLNGRV